MLACCLHRSVGRHLDQPTTVIHRDVVLISRTPRHERHRLQVCTHHFTLISMAKNSSTLTVTSKGQVTFRRPIFDHIRAAYGDCLVVDLLPGTHAEAHAAARDGIGGFLGIPAHPGEQMVTRTD